ncbi:hypothetical protein Ahy_B02g060044 [Arachis hypogaea]|uniref:Aminotransferase-like plant mobile domain-containing protein n=1 Tax=Arachis hypogaea TaxID=3818 RepID=A0A445AHQ5_ARAHY|nr:hypothetical protein Ahy_B02g060044 [Arachis hypogaea]
MATSSSHVAAQDKGKRPMVQPPAPLALHVLNQVNDEVIDDPTDQFDDYRILIPFIKGRKKKLPFFPNAQGEDLLIGQDLDISFFTNQKPFRNNPKIIPCGTDFIAWHERLAPSKNTAWGALGIQDLLRLSHFSPSTVPWMIRVVTFFSGIGLPIIFTFFVAAITRLMISPPDFISDMQPRQQYNIAPTTSYSDFIVHHMGAKGSPITDDEHVAFLFYWLNAIVFCSRSKLFLFLAALLHEGNNLNLAKLILGHIFEELGQFVNCLRKNYLISTGGLLWLLQLWLNAIFAKYMIKLVGGSSDK